MGPMLGGESNLIQIYGISDGFSENINTLFGLLLKKKNDPCCAIDCFFVPFFLGVKLKGVISRGILSNEIHHPYL